MEKLTMTDRPSPIPGMSLRDYFAAKAMHAQLSRPTTWTHDAIARSAYRIADEMLKHQNK